MTFQEKLMALRKQHGWSQEYLGIQIGVSRQTINAIEKGEYNPTIKLCLKICWALDCRLDDLFWEEKENEE